MRFHVASAFGGGQKLLITLEENAVLLNLLLPGALIFFLLSIALYYVWALMPRSGTPEWIYLRERPPISFIGGRYPIDRLDILVMALFVLVWGGISFFNLGDRQAPQTFHGFVDGETLTIELHQPTDVGRIRYYTGLNTGEYVLYFSQDGEEWQRQGMMDQNFAILFQWREADLIDGDGWGVRFIWIAADTNWAHYDALYLGELVIYDMWDNRLMPTQFTLHWSEPARGSIALFDEQDIIPDHASFRNSMYFDEIYHGRTAYEHVLGLWPSELSHPPLGKVLMSIGVHLFGMTPLGWRFMGALLGAFALAVFYALSKNLFGNRMVSICGTLVFAASFMHFAQTRIATIDTYAVLFLLLQFWFLYRYISQGYETPFQKTLPSLALAGIFFGLGAASKWSSLYLAPALALLWLLYQIWRWKYHKRTGKPGFQSYLIKTVLASCVFFLLVPGIIYYLSYIPLAQVYGYGIFSRGHWDIVIENQRHMWWFHNAVTAEHPFASRWYEWVLNLRPILYYLNVTPEGYRSMIMAFGNPLLHWGGLMAMIAMPVIAYREGDGRALAIFFGYLALLLPWVVIARPSFAYHYFTNLIFLALAIAYVFDHLIRRRRGRYQAAIVAVTVVSVGLFVMFYPTLSGWPMSDWYAQNVLRWFDSWPIYEVR